MISTRDTAHQHTGWQDHARRLAETLAERGDLFTPQWQAAVAAVPRHVLVPRGFEQDPNTGEWTGFDTAGLLERVYSPETLITALEMVDGYRQPTSSSTKPDLVVRMLEILDVRDGHRVLEIGTGSGYNAALLTERLGDDQVFTVDVDETLIELARQRLGEGGYHPTVIAADGVAGLPEHAPFDRIIATCSVPEIPWTWAEQLTDGGSILVDLKLATSAGNLALLKRIDDRLEGPFTARWAGFMAMRPPGPVPVVPRAAPAADPHTRTSSIPAEPWKATPVAWFLAQLRLPAGVSFGYDLDPATRRPVGSRLSAPDGSWARMSHDDDRVMEAGPGRLWAAVEWAFNQWAAADRPAWDRLGVTVMPDGGHEIWVDDPRGPHRWQLKPLHLR